MGFRTAADAEMLLSVWSIPPPPPIPAALLRAAEPPQFTVDELVRAVGRKHDVPPAFIKGVIAAESGFCEDAVSPKGAVGLMQLMPDTAREMGAIDPADPGQNVDAGAAYLKQLLDRYGEHGYGLKRAVAAYNAGPANVDRYHGIPPFKETRSYVRRVLALYRYFSLNSLSQRFHLKRASSPDASSGSIS